MYDLLEGIRVLEVALLSPDSLGMHLGDLGAEVIKIEQPPGGDYVRVTGSTHLGGQSLLHLRWNRGKKSVLLDLKQDTARQIFLDLAAQSHVVIDGLRAGALIRYGVGYDAVRAVNPGIVYCSLNGTGQSGPYRELATHGLAFDAYAGLSPAGTREDGMPFIQPSVQVGISAGSLYAAFGVAAALVHAQRTGEGRYLEVAQMDCSVAWQATALDAALNDVETHYQGMQDAVRYQYYRCGDGKHVIFQASERKFWLNFCRGIGREDLLEGGTGAEVADHARGNEKLRRELAEIFASRTRAEWVRFFMQHNVPGGPVNGPDDLADDPHFRSRGLIFEQDHPKLGRYRSFTTPILVKEQSFSTEPAPEPGQHTDEVLSGVLGLDAARLRELRGSGVI
jgi:crotonobetainyl-CoA:carnitine CoA-transferase CaiB-like acyl-CoA transferase